MFKRLFIVSLLGSIVLAGCAGRAWDRARSEDTAAAYADFLREHPGSGHAREARERSALVRVRANPSPESYREYLEQFPDSALLPELRAVAEEAIFEQARATGTVEAYEEFLAEFGTGQYAARARGNAAYLAARGFGGRPAELEAFAREHPQSDFAAEARRSAQAVRARSETGFRRVGLAIQIAPGTPGADRVARVFTERARATYQAAGIALVPQDDSAPVRLTIRHKEEEVRTRLEGTAVTSPGIVATTTVTLARPGASQPIWSEEFQVQVPPTARRSDSSILFVAGTDAFWSSFYVPVVTWDTQAAVRPPRAFQEPVTAVDASGSRAVVLFENGDLHVYELGDPAEPVLVGRYTRPRDLAKWDGVRLASGRALLFGEDGLEIVELGGGARRVGVFERGTVGSLIGVEPMGRDAYVAAGNRGLMLLAAGAPPEILLDREILGLARLGERILFTDGTSMFVSTIPLLRNKRVEGELRLGSGFGPARLRLVGTTAIVLGGRGVVRADVSRPAAPRLISRIDMAEVGRVRDATQLGGRLFLLGERGLQVSDAQGERVVESADIEADARIGTAGRHLVMVGHKAFQVVDATPFLSTGAAAPGR